MYRHSYRQQRLHYRVAVHSSSATTATTAQLQVTAINTAPNTATDPRELGGSQLQQLAATVQLQQYLLVNLRRQLICVVLELGDLEPHKLARSALPAVGDGHVSSRLQRIKTTTGAHAQEGEGGVVGVSTWQDRGRESHFHIKRHKKQQGTVWGGARASCVASCIIVESLHL